EQVQVAIENGVGNLEIGSHDSQDAVEAKLESSHLSLKHSSKVKDNIQKIKIGTRGDFQWHAGWLENNLSVLLGQTLPTSVQIDTGASDVNADFSGVLLNNLDIDAGASNFTIKLGDKSAHTKVNMDVGMSSITYVVPKDSGISVKVDSGL